MKEGKAKEREGRKKKEKRRLETKKKTEHVVVDK